MLDKSEYATIPLLCCLVVLLGSVDAQANIKVCLRDEWMESVQGFKAGRFFGKSPTVGNYEEKVKYYHDQGWVVHKPGDLVHVHGFNGYLNHNCNLVDNPDYDNGNRIKLAVCMRKWSKPDDKWSRLGYDYIEQWTENRINSKKDTWELLVAGTEIGKKSGKEKKSFLGEECDETEADPHLDPPDVCQHDLCNPTQDPPLEGSASGDPHFRTWNGDRYDFHGECDLVLVQNNGFANGLGLHIHVRTKIDTWWSFIQAVAIRIGTHTLEIIGGETQISYWLDGVEEGTDIETGDAAALGEEYPVHFRRINEHQSQTRIGLGERDAISIESFRRFMRVNVKVVNLTKFNGSHGMMGAFPNGKKIARDGETVIEDPIEFGQEWQVQQASEDGMLFHNVDGVVQHPTKCAMPSFTRGDVKRRLGQAAISEEDAALACARVGKEEDRVSCVFDVMATQDKGMAGAYY